MRGNLRQSKQEHSNSKFQTYSSQKSRQTMLEPHPGSIETGPQSLKNRTEKGWGFKEVTGIRLRKRAKETQ